MRCVSAGCQRAQGWCGRDRVLCRGRGRRHGRDFQSFRWLVIDDICLRRRWWAHGPKQTCQLFRQRRRGVVVIDVQ